MLSRVSPGFAGEDVAAVSPEAQTGAGHDADDIGGVVCQRRVQPEYVVTETQAQETQ